MKKVPIAIDVRHKGLTVSQYDLILHALKKLKAEGPSDPAAGICILIEPELEELRKANEVFNSYISARADLAKSWKHYSGNVRYPISHPTQHSTQAYRSTKNLWNRGTEYGRRRWEFLDHLIKGFTNLRRVAVRKQNEYNDLNVMRIVLHDIIQNPPKRAGERSQGLCRILYNRAIVVFDYTRPLHKLLKDYMHDWDLHTGSDIFPVPSPVKGGCARTAYHLCSNKWDQRTKYGKMRWALLFHVKARVENRLVKLGY